MLTCSLVELTIDLAGSGLVAVQAGGTMMEFMMELLRIHDGVHDGVHEDNDGVHDGVLIDLGFFFSRSCL